MPRPISKRDDLINAALVLFMKKGIKGTTTRDIANRAGISEGTIYRHFSSKEELAQKVFEDNLEKFWRFLRRELRNTRNPEDMLCAFIKGIFEFARKHHRRYSFIFSAHQTELRRLSRGKMKPKRMLARILRLGQAQGYFRPMQPDLAAAMILGMVTQTIFYMRNGLIPVSYEDVIREVAQSCLRMIRTETLAGS